MISQKTHPSPQYGLVCGPCAVSTLVFLVASRRYTDPLHEETWTFAFTLVATPCSISCPVMCKKNGRLGGILLFLCGACAR